MFGEKAGSHLLVYTICTAIALIIDLSVMLTGMGKLGEDQDEFGTAFVLIIATMYFLLAFYFIGWVLAVRMRLPEYAKSQVTMGLLGTVKKLTQALEAKTNQLADRRSQKYNQAPTSSGIG